MILFKKLFTRKLKCKHTKQFGETMQTNMIQIFRFSPYKDDSIGFGIWQCSECGKRSFSSLCIHLMGLETCNTIDSFILYKTDIDTFRVFLQKNMKWYKERAG